MTADRSARRRVLREAVGGQRRRVLAAAGLFSSHQACEALVPVVIGVVVDRAIDPSGGGGPRDLAFWIALLAVLFTVLSFSYRLGARFAEAGAEWAGHGLRLSLAQRVLHPRGGAEEGRLPGDLANVATSDARRVGGVNLALPASLAAVAGIVVGGVALVRISLLLGLVVLLGGPLLLWLANLFGKLLERRSEAEQERAAHASGVAADLVAGLRVLKGVGAEDAAADRYRRTSRASLAATMHAARGLAGYEGTLVVMSGAFVALVALVAGRLAIAGDITIGQLVSAVGLAQFMLTPIMVIGWLGSELAQGRASAGRVAEVLGTPHALPHGDAGPAAGTPGAIALHGVRLDVLDGLELRVAAGELVGVVPAEAAEGAALLRVLGREADPRAGRVELDGADLAGLSPDLLRAAVVVAPHGTELFGGTLAENLGGAGPDALAASCAAEVVEVLPGGLAGELAERGGNLSGGQRQRVALARALGTGAPVLVLHDPTTAVDAVTEARIAAGIRDLRRGRTTILVTSGPALLAVTDRVVVLAGGRVRTEGRHHDLLREDDGYRELVLS